MDEEPLVSASINHHLHMQSELLEWLEEFSEKLGKRSNDAISQVHQLLDRAQVLEADLKNTSNSFCSLSHNRYIDHRISDDDNKVNHMKSNLGIPPAEGIRAQIYETDILPRYKESLSFALYSCKNYLQTSKESWPTSSTFKTGSVHGSLPYIIGSEEYIHDNSCGLKENSSLGTAPLDFSCVMESNEVSSAANVRSLSKLLGPHLLGIQECSEKDLTEPVVSAALDFKAMLEAALLNPYKFYDEGKFVEHHVGGPSWSTEFENNDADPVTSMVPEVKPSASSPYVTVTEEKSLPAIKGNFYSLQDSNTGGHKLLSALVSGSLFDTEDDSSCSSQVQPFAQPVLEHGDTVDENMPATVMPCVRSPDASICNDQSIIEDAGIDISGVDDRNRDVCASEKGDTRETVSPPTKELAEGFLRQCARHLSAACSGIRGSLRASARTETEIRLILLIPLKKHPISANCVKLDQADHLEGGSTLRPTDDGKGRSQGAPSRQPVRNDDKKSAIHAEIARVSQLPSNSSYALHRMRILNKLLYLLSIKRTMSEDEELELLFAGLSL